MKKQILLIITACCLLITGCAKHTESKLVGTWMIEDVGDCGWDDDASWTFYSDGRIEVYSDVVCGAGNTEVGTYSVFTRSLVTPFLKIKGMGDLSLNGIWRVEKCNNKKLVMNRVEWLNGESQGAFLRREFTK